MASMFGAWVLLSPGETGANFGIVSLVGYAVGIAGIAVGVVVVAYTSCLHLLQWPEGIHLHRPQSVPGAHARHVAAASGFGVGSSASGDEYDFARLPSEAGLIDEPAACGD